MQQESPTLQRRPTFMTSSVRSRLLAPSPCNSTPTSSRSLSPRLDVGVELHGEGASGLDRTELVVNVGLRCKVGDSCCILVSVGRELHNHFDPRATLVSFVAFQWTR